MCPSVTGNPSRKAAAKSFAAGCEDLQVIKWAVGLIHDRIITTLNPRVQVAGLPFVVPINSDREGL